MPGGQPTDVTALLPDGKRACGLYDGYARLLGARYFDANGNSIDLSSAEDSDGRVDIFALYGDALGIPVFNDNGDRSIASLEKVYDLVTLVRDDQLEPGDNFDNTPPSLPCPNQGSFLRDSDVNLTLDEQEAVNKVRNESCGFFLEDDEDEGLAPR
ncbi:hypothetical protein AWH63_21300 [Marinobacter sp. C18]|uniref:hypothetical protein n=1 Tax=Marinobacter sp. C18 TaxID=1772288 RepID=UPI000948B371|nr:hypothetical protein [Marinobacter sp. C18]OLF83449.1 hypothetical protein AWH63_21300 [Marinobacter sp. C18]